MKMESHLTLVAALNIGFGACFLVIAGIVFLAVAGGGWLSGDPEAITITSIVASAISGFLIIISVPGIIAGIGLLRRDSWARILSLIIACLDLLNIPIGTLFGIYAIWVLMNDEVAEMFNK